MKKEADSDVFFPLYFLMEKNLSVLQLYSNNRDNLHEKNQ
jgi:hypothetical protein